MVRVCVVLMEKYVTMLWFRIERNVKYLLYSEQKLQETDFERCYGLVSCCIVNIQHEIVSNEQVSISFDYSYGMKRRNAWNSTNILHPVILD